MDQGMNIILNGRLDDINYTLPEEKIARYPLNIRHSSKLLVYNHGNLKDESFFNISNSLPKGSLLIFNNTRVVRARMHFKKATGSLIEIFCLEPIDPADYERAFSITGRSVWKCLVGNLKKWKGEILVKAIEINNKKLEIRAKLIANTRDHQIIEFTWSDEKISFSELLEQAGETPIPPYLKRKSEPMDKERYQTIYARLDGSVAAPTAGLHFTPEVIKSIAVKRVETLELTLHVGAGTFKPMLNNSAEDHIMHTEHFSMTREAIEKLSSFKGNIIAIGTTSVRALESLYFIGVKLHFSNTIGPGEFHVSQWEWKEILEEISIEKALNSIILFLESEKLEAIYASTQIMIIPGYKFRLIDGMVTNFHQPKSTLLLLVSALIGEDWKKVYKHALSNEYRFLSYGDSSLLIKPRE